MSNSEHIEDIQADPSHKRGCVTKCVGSKFKKHHGSYRRNGYVEIKGDAAKKARYEPLPARLELFGGLESEQQIGQKKGVERTPDNPLEKPGAWKFVGKNYKTANRPFVHMYHHMVPWEVMSETFTAPELRLIQNTGYHLNEGINLIILPCFEKIGIVLGLFTHPYDHPAYTLELIEMLTRLKNQLKGDEEKHLKAKDVAQIRSVLEDWEKTEWFKIAEAGREALGAQINDYKPSELPEAAATAISG